MNPLLDSNFLIKLDNDKNRTIYARIISLNQYEHPIEQLEGVVTAGSITIDGQSAVRRVCSLTLSAKNLNINNVYWGLTTKVKIEIGVQNNIIGYEHYGEIIWFEQGIFILTDFKTTQTINNYTINLTGKDKMCLLNGDVAGNLANSICFDSYSDANEQSHIINANDYDASSKTYNYNNFIDDKTAEAILAGFQERYGDSYSFIRGIKKINSLTYIPKNGKIASSLLIQFSSGEQGVPLVDIAIEAKDKINGKVAYNINLNDKTIYGFMVKNCLQDDEFIWSIEQKIPIPIIIQELLHQYGQERYSNIIIKDIESYGLEMLDSVFDSNYYLLHDGTTYCNFISQKTLINNYCLFAQTNKDGTNKILTNKEGKITNIIFRKYFDEDDPSLIEILSGSTLEQKATPPTVIIKKKQYDKKYTVQPIYKNETAGYAMIPLVYPETLTASPGDSITSILDKLVNFLGDYEYFYDLKGQFVFQKKPAYVKTAWNNNAYIKVEDNYIPPSELKNKVVYTFDDSVLTSQYQNSPNINNIKNDYIIWGERQNTSNQTVKFHGRYAIEDIPLEYTDFNGYTWTSNKRKSLLEAIYNSKKQADKEYIHIYNYPKGYEPEKTNWWEINDWGNFYSSIFGIDLNVNATQLQEYRTLKTDADVDSKVTYDKNFKDSIQSDILKFKQGILSGYSSSNLTFKNIVTIIYTNKDKTQIKSIYLHNPGTYYYAQFIDVRKLDIGWDYRKLRDEEKQIYSIVNTWNPNEKYLLVDNTQIKESFHPDYTTTFIYRPILPNDLETYSDDILLKIIYTDAKNENNIRRRYALTHDVDWRQLINVMADDWYQHHTEDDYEINLRMNNSWPDLNIDLYPYGRTGYEQYYIDFTSNGGLWSTLYNIYSLQKKYFDSHKELLPANSQESDIFKIYNKKKYDNATNITKDKTYLATYFSGGSYRYWNKDVINNPENLIFWFDFFNADKMGIGKFATSVIGDRPKIINDTSIKTIIYRDTPDVIYCDWLEYKTYYNARVLKDGYVYILLNNKYEGVVANTIEDYLFAYENLLQARDLNDSDEITKYQKLIKSYGYTESTLKTLYDSFQSTNRQENYIRSIRHKTVHDQADTMLYQYSYYNDTVTISSVPIYYLQPNTIISTKDELSRVTGYYVMNKISISLAYNGMMQITAIKSPERIY